MVVLIMLIGLELEAKSGDHIRYILHLEFYIDILLLIYSDFLDVMRT